MNVDFYDVRITEGTMTTIMVDNGKVEEISSSFNKGAAVRALIGGSWGFVSTDDITRVDKAIEDASTLARKMNAKKPRDKVILAQCGTEHISEVAQVLKDPQNIPIEDKVSLLMDIEEHMKLPRIHSTSIMYLQGSAVSSYYNSEGLECDRTTTHCGCAITAVAKNGSAYQASRESRFGVKGFELFDENDFFKLAEHAASTADSLLDASAPKGGTMPVILDPELAGVFIHEAVGHASEADIVLEGGSCLEGKLGEKIASGNLRVIDDPTFKGYGYYTFDSEGSKAKKTTIIDNGFLNSYLHNRETAGKLGGEPCNARAQGMSVPVVRMSNTYIDNGDSSFEEMCSEIKDGIYLIGSRGGQVNPAEGVFQFNAERGFLIKDGEISMPLRDVSLAGNTIDILQNILLIGKDLTMNSGRCGKSGQSVPVSDGSPHIAISKAVVGGSG